MYVSVISRYTCSNSVIFKIFIYRLLSIYLSIYAVIFTQMYAQWKYDNKVGVRNLLFPQFNAKLLNREIRWTDEWMDLSMDE